MKIRDLLDKNGKTGCSPSSTVHGAAMHLSTTVASESMPSRSMRDSVLPTLGTASGNDSDLDREKTLKIDSRPRASKHFNAFRHKTEASVKEIVYTYLQNLRKLTRRISLLERNNERSQKQIDMLDKENERLREQIFALAQQNSKLENQYGNLHEQCASLRARMEKIES